MESSGNNSSAPGSSFIIRPYKPGDESEVIALWNEVFPRRVPHHDSKLSIDRKTAVDPELLFVAYIGNRVVGTTMGGYDGRRGWIYSVSVHPDYRKPGFGTKLLHTVEAVLRRRSCLNPSFAAENEYVVEPIISMGKKLY